MEILPLVPDDLERLRELQPPDWIDIIPFFQFYLISPFCKPVKAIEKGKIIGVGSVIFHKYSAWLAHIIVHSEYRSRGTGYAITRALIDLVHTDGCLTILLIASESGEPVYRKCGFEAISEYVFYQGGHFSDNPDDSDFLAPFGEIYTYDVLNLDREVSGEDRTGLLMPHLGKSTLYIRKDMLLGFHMPTLGEGLIMAKDPEAGLTLLRSKRDVVRIVVPVENRQAVDFLTKNGFFQHLKGTRMCLGMNVSWKPEMIYCRIGGNLG